MSRFVRPDTTRLYLADVHRRAHEALLKRTKPRKATSNEIATSAALLKAAEAEGDWIEVRKQLSEGERRAAHTRMYVAGIDGRMRADPLQTGMATVTAFLVDWGPLEHWDDTPIRGLSADDLAAVLDNLDPESFAEIRLAIEHHEQAVLVEQQEKKLKTTTAPESVPTLRSVS